MTNTCIRCGNTNAHFPKKDNRMTCGHCLSELHAMHFSAEVERNNELTAQWLGEAMSDKFNPFAYSKRIG